MYTKAIVRTPGRCLVDGITSAGLGIPNYDIALVQHRAYIDALKDCGLEVLVLPADERYPDSVFIEDTALLTPKCAIITNPGANSRKGEIIKVKAALGDYYQAINVVHPPGTIDGGDILMIGSHFYIGLSERTNLNGANQLADILKNFGMTTSFVNLQEVLHLKTGVAYLENNNLVACGEFLENPEFNEFNILAIDDDENYAANCLWVNNVVIIPQGFPKTKQTIQSAGYQTIQIDVSEFQKLDGGLSCLSLRF